MAKTNKATYFAPISIGAGGCWGSGADPETALKNACKEAVEFARALGGFKPDTRLEVNVFEIRPGCYAYQSERGIFEVDYDTDVIVAYAKVTQRFVEVPPKNPAKAVGGDPKDAYHDGGVALESCNANATAPIGDKIAA